MTMERYNWIKAYYHDTIVGIRQVSKGSGTFVDGAGNEFDISELDFTRNCYEPQTFDIEELEKRNKEINQKYQEGQVKYIEMLSKMDANSIADHKAKIDEREYWRKLRCEIFASLCKDYKSYSDALKQTETIINRLYKQDQELFKDK